MKTLANQRDEEHHGRRQENLGLAAEAKEEENKHKAQAVAEGARRSEEHLSGQG